MSGTGQTMAGPGEGRPTLTAGTAILFAGVIASFIVFILVFFLYLRAKRYWGAIPGRAVPVPPAAPAAAQCGLNISAVAALPSVVFRGDRVEEGVVCAVCLCELADGEAGRLLPRCGHSFHLECIDLWFTSHSTCPLCRGAVLAGYPERGACSAVAGGGARARQEESSPQEIPASLLLGASEQGSSGASGSSSGIEMEAPPSSPLTASVLTEEEAAGRSPLLQAAALRSLRRLLVRGGRAGVGGDVEQGSVRESKAPTSS